MLLLLSRIPIHDIRLSALLLYMPLLSPFSRRPKTAGVPVFAGCV